MGKSKAAKPTRDQKQLIHAAGYNPRDWLVIWESPVRLMMVHKGTGTSRVIKKDPNGGHRGGSNRK